MPAIHVTPLSRLRETVDASGASHVVTLINISTPVERPSAIAPERHLFIGVSDIVDPLDGHVLPADAHVEQLLAFTRLWDQARPLVIHCWAGISRSTAAAYITLCALRPERDEFETARLLRAAAPSATPNARLVQVADALLDRRGRMVAAIAEIGRGADAFEGTPFRLPLDRT
ncbi:MAG: tyrosine phosphatase family protein [Alsobacter sp.]